MGNKLAIALVASASMLGATSASAAPDKEHAEAHGKPADHGKPEVSGAPAMAHGKDEAARPGDKGKDDKGKDDKAKDDKAKDDKAKDDKTKPGAPPGLEGKTDERHQRLLARFEERKKTAPDRRKAERDEAGRKWGAALDRAPIREELRRHARAVARIDRIKDVAEADAKADLATRAAAALDKENARHDRRMAALASGNAPAAPSASGGAP